ncbi:ABC-type uncharacterized transport system ATPase component [Kitasatospora sp. Ki12]|uniref:ABC transporter ATP-binding protein n=1 Tax=Kitasatospora xanthocidica TaxID=83382 RepID=UPI00167B0916|nr:ATP-binding cassette domain-containing protein [Kitasatospora xanthocidica]GHF64527.1 ABC transporter ATP-binding protein [Kitasatospora xanthocidica]
MKPLTYKGVTKSYGSHQALDRLDFTVHPGQIFGFVGGNGAGKTTALRIAAGVLAADQGAVYWGDSPVGRPEAARFGYMPEERGLYPKMTVAKQLLYLGRLHGQSTAQARSAMTRWTRRLGIDAHHDKPIDTLSLGNQQRVQLAAALIHDPDVLILDEPFSGLDPSAVDDMSEVLREKAAQGVPVLFSSHQLDLVERLCDRVGVIAAGRLAAEGSLDELRAPRTGHSLYLEVEGAPPGWPEGTPAVASYRPDAAGVLVELADGHTENDLLAEAVRHGTVRALNRRRPTLTELFRDLVDPAKDGTPA